jgi:hypothetical protein
MEKELKKVYEHYRKHYFNDQIVMQIKDKVHQEINNKDLIQYKNKKNNNFAKRTSFVAASCLVLFGLFIGSAFVSPTMAEVASQIPFLNKIFEQKPIYEDIREKLEEKGYEIAGVGYSLPGKTYHVTVEGSEEYYNQVKEEIKKTTESVISSRGYDDFKVEVGQPRKIEPEPANDPKYRDSMLALDALNGVVPKLQQEDYKIHNYGGGFTGPDAKVIRLDLYIEDTEKRTDEIEKTIFESIIKLDIKKEVTIKFHPFNVKERDIEKRWISDILPVIWEGMLSKKEYKTNGVGYSYKKGTMNILITTTIDNSDDEAAELANKIEGAIHEFLQTDDLKNIVGNTPYKIVVKDKNDKEIN